MKAKGKMLAMVAGAALLACSVARGTPWKEDDVAITDGDVLLTPTTYEGVSLKFDGEAAKDGDVVAVFRDGDVFCGYGEVFKSNLEIVVYASKDEPLSLKVWRSGTDDAAVLDVSKIVVGGTETSQLLAPNQGEVVAGLALVYESKPDTHTLTFNTAGGSVVAPVTQATGTAVTAPAAPTRTGHTFTGWNPAVPATMPAEDMTLTAQWKVNQYTLTFNANGGSAVAPVTQDYGTAVTAPAAPTRTGHTFEGWSPAVPATVPASNVTYTAQWKANQYTLTFNANGGSSVAPVTQGYGTAVTAPASPTRTGYTFMGWIPAVPATMPAEDMTLTAQWKVNVYLITYLPGDNGTGSQQTDTKTQDVALTLKGAIFTRAGYTQVGWVTSDGAKAYDLGASYSANAAVTLYPAWRVNDDPPRPTDTVNEPWTATQAETLNGALYDGDGNVCGTVQIKVAKPNVRKGTVRVSGSVTPISGKKVTLKAVTVPVPPDTPIKASVNAKALGTLEVAIGDDGFEGTLGSWKVRKANVGGKWTRGDAKVYVDFDGGGALPVGTQTGFLPDGEPVIPKNGKWAFAKATQVKWAKNKTTGLKGLSVNVDKGKTNRSGLKLTYTHKTGVFKGSFKIYAVVDGSLKRHTVKVNGVVVDGEGSGLATLNNSGGWAVIVGTNGAATGTEEEPEVIGPFDTDKVTTLPGDDPIVSTDGKVSTADFKTWITGIAVVGSFDEYLAADLAKLSYVSPKNAISVYYGQVVVIRIVYDYPANYLGYAWVADEWPDGLPAGWTYPFDYGGSGQYRGRGIAYGYISFNANYTSCTLHQISVRARAEPMPDGFPSFKVDGTVYPADWRSSVTPVNIQFR